MEVQELKPYELHLGHGDTIDMKGIYCCGAVHEEWQMLPDHSGEYKGILHYTYSAHRALELIDQGYAMLDFIKTYDTSDTEYHLIMRRNY